MKNVTNRCFIGAVVMVLVIALIFFDIKMLGNQKSNLLSKSKYDDNNINDNGQLGKIYKKLDKLEKALQTHISEARRSADDKLKYHKENEHTLPSITNTKNSLTKENNLSGKRNVKYDADNNTSLIDFSDSLMASPYKDSAKDTKMLTDEQTQISHKEHIIPKQKYKSQNSESKKTNRHRNNNVPEPKNNGITKLDFMGILKEHFNDIVDLTTTPKSSPETLTATNNSLGNNTEKTSGQKYANQNLVVTSDIPTTENPSNFLASSISSALISQSSNADLDSTQNKANMTDTIVPIDGITSLTYKRPANAYNNSDLQTNNSILQNNDEYTQSFDIEEQYNGVNVINTKPVKKDDGQVNKKDDLRKASISTVDGKHKGSTNVNKKQNDPVDNEKQNDPVDSKKQNDPVDSKKQNDPVDNEKQNDPVDNEKQNDPVDSKKQNEISDIDKQNSTNVVNDDANTNDSNKQSDIELPHTEHIVFDLFGNIVSKQMLPDEQTIMMEAGNETLDDARNELNSHDISKVKEDNLEEEINKKNVSDRTKVLNTRDGTDNTKLKNPTELESKKTARVSKGMSRDKQKRRNNKRKKSKGTKDMGNKQRKQIKFEGKDNSSPFKPDTGLQNVQMPMSHSSDKATVKDIDEYNNKTAGTFSSFEIGMINDIVKSGNDIIPTQN